MNFLDQGIKSYEENNYFESANLLKSFLNEKNDDEKNNLLSYSYLYKIFQIDGDNFNLKEEIIEYASLLLESRDFEQSKTILQDLHSRKGVKELGVIKFKLYECLKMMGDVGGARKIGMSLANYYFWQRNFQKGKEFIKYYEESFRENKITSIYQILFMGLAGDFEGIDSSKDIMLIVNDYYLEVLNPNEEKNLDDLLDLLISKDRLIGRNTLLRALILKRKSDLVTVYGFLSDDYLSQKEELVTDIYEFLVYNHDSIFPYLLTLNFAINTKNKPLGLSVKAVLLGRKEMIAKNPATKNRVKEMIFEIDQMKESKIRVVKDIDFSEFLEDEKEASVENFEKADNLNDSIENSILFEDQLTNLNEASKAQILINEASLIKSIELVDDNFLIKSYQDYLSCCLFLEFYKAAFFVLDRTRELADEEDEINLIYLENEILFRQGKYLESLSNVDICLSTIPLSLREKETFLGLKLRLLKRLGDKKSEQHILCDLKKIKVLMRENLRSIC